MKNKPLLILMVIITIILVITTAALVVTTTKNRSLESKLSDTETNLQVTKETCNELENKLSESEQMVLELSEFIEDNEELLKISEETSDDELTPEELLEIERRKWMSLKIILHSTRTKFLGFIEDGEIYYITYQLRDGRFVLFSPDQPVQTLTSITQIIEENQPVPLDKNLEYGGLDIDGVSFMNFYDEEYVLEIVSIRGKNYLSMKIKT